MKKISIIILLFAVLAYTASSIAADCSTYVLNLDGDQNKGQVLYRENCLSACHNSNGPAKLLFSTDKTQAEWKEYIDNLASIPCIKNWPASLTEEETSNIFSYLHARSSDSPMFPS